LKEYVPCFRVFSDPAAFANMLDWIKSTQGELHISKGKWAM